MTTKKQELVPLTEEQLAVLNESFPVGDEQSRLLLPRFGMLAKDITEETGTGKNKKITVLQSAGTFYTETDKGEVDEKGKKVSFTEGQLMSLNRVATIVSNNGASVVYSLKDLISEFDVKYFLEVECK